MSTRGPAHNQLTHSRHRSKRSCELHCIELSLTGSYFVCMYLCRGLFEEKKTHQAALASVLSQHRQNAQPGFGTSAIATWQKKPLANLCQVNSQVNVFVADLTLWQQRLSHTFFLQIGAAYQAQPLEPSCSSASSQDSIIWSCPPMNWQKQLFQLQHGSRADMQLTPPSSIAGSLVFSSSASPVLKEMLGKEGTIYFMEIFEAVDEY